MSNTLGGAHCPTACITMIPSRAMKVVCPGCKCPFQEKTGIWVHQLQCSLYHTYQAKRMAIKHPAKGFLQDEPLLKCPKLSGEPEEQVFGIFLLMSTIFDIFPRRITMTVTLKWQMKPGCLFCWVQLLLCLLLLLLLLQMLPSAHLADYLGFHGVQSNYQRGIFTLSQKSLSHWLCQIPFR